MVSRNTRTVSWVKAAKKDFMKFPAPVRETMETALTIIADGAFPDTAKAMKGLGSGIFEISKRYDKDTYRSIYAMKINEDIWVIHAFKKKSKSGVKTPREEIDLVKARIKQLKAIMK